jgi:YVTN family beta-propeller protein
VFWSRSTIYLLADADRTRRNADLPVIGRKSVTRVEAGLAARLVEHLGQQPSEIERETMPKVRTTSARRCAAVAVTAALLAAGAASASPTSKSADAGMRDVVFVANAEGGTVTIVDARTFDVVRELNVVPDGRDATLGEDDPVHALVGQRIVEAAGGENVAQDLDLSPDGRTLYVSRGHRGDVAAFELATGAMRWKTPISGVRADHMTISDDGSRLYVSALTENVVEVLDAATGAVVDSFATGEWPHDNHLSHDGERLYNASIGNITTPTELRAARHGTGNPALREPYQLTVVDADTLGPVRTYAFERGIRPYVVTDDDTRLYAQLSELHGLVEFDLDQGRITRSLDLPIDEGVTEDDYSFEAPHHGLAITPDETTLCAAGRASDYVALVSTSSLQAEAIIEVGDTPSWAATSSDGRYCFVPNTGDDTLSVVSYAARKEVARVPVGDGPKHIEIGAVPRSVLPPS